VDKSRKKLSPDGLWAETHQYFSKKLDHLNQERRSSAVNIVDCVMAGAAVFSMKLPSLLKYDISRRSDLIFANLKNLFHIQNPPSDTCVRERLDELEPAQIRGVFKRLFAQVIEGKALEPYDFYRGHKLMLIDATGHFYSDDVHCKNCCVKNHKDGTVSYYHQMLAAVIAHPDMKRVIPLAPEPITKQDGTSKNDCEHNAAKRLLMDFRREHPHLKTIVSEDSLYSTGPHVKLLQELDIRFIIGAKPGNLGTLFDWVKNLDREYEEFTDAKGKHHRFAWINKVPLNDTHFDTKVNLLEYWETDKKGKIQHFSWITDLELNKKNVAQVMRGGRARWRIENETFNTLKNQGYEFEHNFGHGEKNLCTIFAMLMLLAFFIDQVSELCNQLFQKAKHAAITYKALWQHWHTLIGYTLFESWDVLLGVVAREIKVSLNSS
jgi:hypothetical protein